MCIRDNRQGEQQQPDFVLLAGQTGGQQFRSLPVAAEMMEAGTELVTQKDAKEVFLGCLLYTSRCV